ncbi:MAG: hypothetical protein JWO44_368 [Bacteroidetes bacterium]|nr:hypothetical protein [Bacteroidota bacterium]
MACTLYRAITQREYDDILTQGNRFRIREFTLEAKQFAVSEECGHYYGREIVMRFDRVNYILLRVTLNLSAFCQDVMVLDDCRGVTIPFDRLEGFNNAITELVPVNLN